MSINDMMAPLDTHSDRTPSEPQEPQKLVCRWPVGPQQLMQTVRDGYQI